MSSLIQVAVLAGAFLAGFSSQFLFKKRPDNLIEETAEAVIKHQTGIDIDFTPDSIETSSTIKPSVIIVSQEEWDEINIMIENLEKDPQSQKKAGAVKQVVDKYDRRDLPLIKEIVPDHEDFDNVFIGDHEGLDIEEVDDNGK